MKHMTLLMLLLGLSGTALAGSSFYTEFSSSSAICSDENDTQDEEGTTDPSGDEEPECD